MQRVLKLGKLACPCLDSLCRMPPCSSPLREDTRLRVLSAMQRQLAPIVGQAASGGRNRAGSAYLAGRYPFVPPDKCWIPARTNTVRLSIILIGGIHIFIGETVD